ncbi:MAG: S24/S26 family peptidase [Prevotella sp.]|nr:S24/S26 family peptidase [Prevotella sp.]
MKTVYADILIKETIAMLQEGRRVVLPVKGTSMHPFIISGKDSVELISPSAPLKEYDVVWAWVEGSRYVIHRIIGIDGNQLTLMGDGNSYEVEHCRTDEVLALAEYVIAPNGKRRYLYTKTRLGFARLWRRLLPVRRWLLAIYRRTFLKLNITI